MPRAGRNHFPFCISSFFSINLNVAMIVFMWCCFSHFKAWTIISRDACPQVSASRSLESIAARACSTDRQCLAALGPHNCPTSPFLAWDDWRACMQKHLTSAGWSAVARTDTFEDFIIRCKTFLPWTMSSNHTAVLLEFRALERQMQFSIDNIMNNLPVHWRLQIVGGRAVNQLASKLFAAEVTAEKVLLTPLEYENIKQVISK